MLVTLLHFVASKAVKFLIASSKATLELLSTISFTATNNSWASRGMVCLNKGQILLPCYWPFYRSERHQLGKAVTMPPVTFPLWCEQHFTDHGAELARKRRKANFWQTRLVCIIHTCSLSRIMWDISEMFYLTNSFTSYKEKICCRVCDVLSLLLFSWDRQGQPPQVWARYHRPCWPYGHLNMHTGRAS